MNQPQRAGDAACQVFGYNIVRPGLSTETLIHLLQRRLIVRDFKKNKDKRERANHAFLVGLRAVINGNEEAAKHYAKLLQRGFTDMLLWTCTRDEAESIKKNGRVRCGRYYAVALDPNLDPKHGAGQRVRMAVMHRHRMRLVSGNRARILETFCANTLAAHKNANQLNRTGATRAWIAEWARITEVAQEDREDRRDDGFEQRDAALMAQAEQRYGGRGAARQPRPEAPPTACLSGAPRSTTGSRSSGSRAAPSGSAAAGAAAAPPRALGGLPGPPRITQTTAARPPPRSPKTTPPATTARPRRPAPRRPAPSTRAAARPRRPRAGAARRSGRSAPAAG